MPIFELQVPAEMGLRTQQGSADHGEPGICHIYQYNLAFLIHCFTAVAFQGENGVWKITTTLKSLSWLL